MTTIKSICKNGCIKSFTVSSENYCGGEMLKCGTKIALQLLFFYKINRNICIALICWPTFLLSDKWHSKCPFHKTFKVTFL